MILDGDSVPGSDADTDSEPDARLRSPAELVAAVPYLLGFHPRDSLVLVCTRGHDVRRVAFACRVDLPARRHVAELAGQMAGMLARLGCDGHGCEEVLVVVVGGGSEATSLPRSGLVTALARACDAVGVTVAHRVWVPEIAAGARWRCYGPGGRGGVLPDPASSPVAAAAVAAGQVTYPDRADLERLVAPVDPAALARRGERLSAHCDRESRREEPAPDAAADTFALVSDWVARAEEDPLDLGDDEVVALCLALSDPMVRDAAFGLAVGANAAGAERLWTALVRESPDPEAAEAAVLLAHCALIRGNGALTGIALARAQSAWPGHRLSELFRCALDDGLGPDELSRWFAEGAAEAGALLRGRAAR